MIMLDLMGCVMLACLIVMGIVASVCDIRNGLIPNRLIVVILSIGIVMDVVYYGIIHQDRIDEFALNITAVLVLSILLFYTKSLAGGDCKLLFALSLLYPANSYLIYAGIEVTLFSTICFSFFLGWGFLLVRAVVRIIIGKSKIDGGYVVKYLTTYVKTYLTAMLYIMIINMLFVAYELYVGSVYTGIIWGFCVAVAILSSKVRVLRNRFVIIGAIVICVVLAIVLQVVPISINPSTYLFTAGLVLCQMAIRTDLYETIATKDVKRGMILSSVSSTMMQNTRVKGIPKISDETLGSRLTESEADSVRRWGKSKNGRLAVSIVRKMPFAVFVLLGYICYFSLWSIVS